MAFVNTMVHRLVVVVFSVCGIEVDHSLCVGFSVSFHG